VVTGGASGIGWACARSLSREGCNVALWDQSTDVKKAAHVLAQEFNGSSLGIAVDVCDSAAVKEAVRQTESELGPIRHVVHAAAVGSGRFGYPFTNLEPADWPRVLQVNILGMVHVAHAVVPGKLVPRPIPLTVQAKRPTSTLPSAWRRIWRRMEFASML
jgi:2-hydroxycyclohexanecarboxyl-CoA dehydrogenase